MAAALSLCMFTTDQLAHDKSLLQLFLLINQAYKRPVGHTFHDGAFDRYLEPSELVQDLGSDGLCAFIQDNSKDNIPVAVAIAKRWKGPESDGNANHDGQDWEIGPVASRADPQYRKKGLVDQCLKALYAHLLQTASIRLWVKAIKDINGEYWRRKGFQETGPSFIIPKGEWHRDRAFEIIVMVLDCREKEELGTDVINGG